MTPEAWIALCVGLIAIPVAVVQSFQTRRHRVRDYELAFMQRYWTLIDRIPSPRSGEPHDAGPRDRDERAAIELYLELCEDEIDQRRLGLISDATWRMWRDGIGSALGSEPYATTWKNVRDRDPNRFDCLKEFSRHRDAETLAAYDPCTLSWIARGLRGLTGS